MQQKLLELVEKNDYKTLEEELKILRSENNLELLNDYIETAGYCLIHAACIKLSYESLELLLQFGADPNKKEKRLGLMPLHIVADKCHIESVRVLLLAGADINATYEITTLSPKKNNSDSKKYVFNALSIAYLKITEKIGDQKSPTEQTKLFNFLYNLNIDNRYSLDAAIQRKDMVAIFLFLLNMKSVDLTSDHTVLGNLRKELWEKIKEFTNLPANYHYGIQALEQISKSSTALGKVFNYSDSFLKQNQPEKPQSKYLTEATKMLGDLQSKAKQYSSEYDENEITPLLDPTKNFPSYN